MNKKLKTGLILVAFGVILLAAFPMVIILRGAYRRRIEDCVLELANKENDIEKIGRANHLLYAAGNNFRIYTLTKKSSRLNLYTMELAEVSMLLDTISQSHHKNRYFQQLVANKKLNATLLLKAKLYSDSLLMQAYYLENNLSGIIGNDVKLHGTSSREFKEKTDTSIGQTPLAYQKNDKGLFKRIKDAIPNKPAKSDGQTVSAEELSIKKPEEYDTDEQPVLSDTA
jgi:hypothetical protein